MNIKYFVSISIFWIIAFNIPMQAQESVELKQLKKIVFDRIKEDRKNQDTSYSLFPLKIDNNIKGTNSKISLKDSAQFTFQGGCYLRFYLVCSGESGNIAHLRLYRMSGSKTIPNWLLKEISCSTTENKVATFDYYLKDIENFKILLTLDKNIPASAFVFGTQFKPKKTK